MSISRVVFTGEREAILEDLAAADVGEGQVRARGICSLVSTGTENIIYNRLFATGSHWDNWIKYPFYPGYAWIGEVVEIGTGVTEIQVGDRVALRSGHASQHIAAASDCVLVPPDIDPRQAAWFALAKIAFMGSRVADYRLGDSVVVIGAGPIGQMSARWAAAAGAESVVVIDPAEDRLGMAVAGGATATIGRPVSEAFDAVRLATGGSLPRVVIDGTGNAAVFSQALQLVAERGTLVLLGDTGFPSEQTLTADVVLRGIRVVGAHDGHTDAIWNDVTIPRLFFSLVRSGRFSVAGLDTHVFSPDQVHDAYDLLNSRRSGTIGVLFDWTLLDK